MSATPSNLSLTPADDGIRLTRCNTQHRRPMPEEVIDLADNVVNPLHEVLVVAEALHRSHRQCNQELVYWGVVAGGQDERTSHVPNILHAAKHIRAGGFHAGSLGPYARDVPTDPPWVRNAAEHLRACVHEILVYTGNGVLDLVYQLRKRLEVATLGLVSVTA
ncbi:hypothetical protein F503_04189 [Ophiostoma piceae UAMH 11346]|uniref:Uncharacterized protein n=1 Tax=Ophiostoma piceae (strain UAMH 11346) TaxID=1262450 RepID=S3C721_OPHP1|nr:hypothetical protein F503_04189 [Ophiostoma piceae UAMH 11346]